MIAKKKNRSMSRIASKYREPLTALSQNLSAYLGQLFQQFCGWNATIRLHHNSLGSNICFDARYTFHFSKDSLYGTGTSLTAWINKNPTARTSIMSTVVFLIVVQENQPFGHLEQTANHKRTK